MPLVTTADHDHVRLVTLVRPEARNALSTAVLGELADALQEALADPAVGVLVLTGADGHFSAGADVREDLDRDGHVRRLDLLSTVYEALVTSTIPTVAAVQGACVGGGAEIAMACDLRVADHTARFRFPGAALGVPIGPAKLIGLVGLGTAKDLVLTSRTIDAAEAHRVGLVQRLVDPAPDGAGAVPAALEVAATIAGQHADAIRTVKARFLAWSGTADRLAAENDQLRALAEAGGDYGALTMPDPKRLAPWGVVPPR